MDPISLAVLAALAGGAGGEIGRQAWAGLVGLVRRRTTAPTTPAAPSTPGGAAPAPVAAGEEPTVVLNQGQAGADEDVTVALTALEGNPGDRERARELERVLRARIDADADFARAVRIWEAGFNAALDVDPQAAAQIRAAAVALDPQADSAPGAVHNDFRHGKFDGPVQGSGTQNNHFNR